MFFMKMIQVKASRVYTIEELYERIKDIPFEAGPPVLVHYGFAHVICFPEQDNNNQVQIRIDGKNRIYVQKGVQAMGAEQIARSLAMNRVTGGLYGMSMLGGSKKKICETLVKKTADQLNNIQL